MIPVNPSTNDPHYRYMMPSIQTNNDSSKTFLVNLNQVAKSLSRNPSHILKYISFALGCSSIDGSNGLNVQFEESKIQAQIYDFINHFVLCPGCENPETKFIFEQSLQRRCSSCGGIFDQSPHKLNNYILKEREKANGHDIYVLDEVHSKMNVSNIIIENQSKIDVVERGPNNPNDIFSDFIKVKDLSKFDEILKASKINNILLNIENMLERNNKEDKIDIYLDYIQKIGFPIEDIEGYFDAPRINKKRSPPIKKNVNYYFEQLN